MMKKAMLGLGLLAAGAKAGGGCREDVDWEPPHAAHAEIHRVATQDGATVALVRYPSSGPPVVLVHGISSNHHFWDLMPGRSLALALSEAGYDVWNLDLRGHAQARIGLDGAHPKAGWTVDDYGRYDLPAAFDYVREKSGRDELHYVGHSMGGMVLAVYLANTEDPPLASAVAVGSPLDFRDPDAISHLGLASMGAAGLLDFVPSPVGSQLLARIKPGPLPVDDMLFNPENLASSARSEMYRRIVSPMSRGEVRQFALAADGGEFLSADGATVYREALSHVRVPMLFVAGRADRVASPDRVRGYFEAVGSPDKRFLVASQANGHHADYGHLDMGVGDWAAVDLFPEILAWLAEHPASGPPPVAVAPSVGGEVAAP